MKLAGYVDRADSFLIEGWAMCDDRPAHQPTINIIQREKVVHALKPLHAAPDLRQARNMPAHSTAPIYRWRFWMPLANGVLPDVPFTIAFSETGRPLPHGLNRKIDSFDNCDTGALNDLGTREFMFPSYEMTKEGLKFSVRIERPASLSSAKLQVGEKIILPTSVVPSILGKKSYFFSFVLPETDVTLSPSPFVICPLNQDNATEPLQKILIPKKIFDSAFVESYLPPQRNITRVSGPKSERVNYLIGGATTYFQMSELLKNVFRRPINSFNTILDWGVGCGRVIRQFWEAEIVDKPTDLDSHSLIGVDIDEVNLNWCQTHLQRKGVSFEILSLDGFSLGDESVDLLYGISVFTHLSEWNQNIWLREIRRILRPGGIAVVTVHGEGAYYRNTKSLAFPFVTKFGFFDGIADSAIGEDRSLYYRATYHSRKYIKQHWSKYFEIVKVVPMANAFLQDYVVLRK